MWPTRWRWKHATFTDTVSRTRRFYQLVLIDCGAEIEHSVIPAVLSASDALMIVGSCSVEGGLAVETTIDWLAARNGHELLKRSVVVLNDSYRSASKDFISHVTDDAGKASAFGEDNPVGCPSAGRGHVGFPSAAPPHSVGANRTGR